MASKGAPPIPLKKSTFISHIITLREYSSKPLKHIIVKRVLVFKRWIWAYFIPYKFFICSDFLAENLVIRKL